MGWQDLAREYSGEEYVAPEVTQQKLDLGGNYVSPASSKGDSSGGLGGVIALGSTGDPP